MDHVTDAMEIVDLFTHPAFCVTDGIITKVNTAAQMRMIEAGTAITDLIKDGAEEYFEFFDGCLYLTLRICDTDLGFSVIRRNGFDLFRLEQDAQNEELQAMALAARELREPLASIMISANHLFPSSVDPEDSKVCEQMTRINRGLFQMLRLISNMSDANRYASSTPVSMEVKNIVALLDEIFHKASGYVEQAGLRLEYTGLQEEIYCPVNQELLERAALNAVSNALKFTPAGGVIQVRVSHRNSKLYLSVQDNGAGIPEQLRGTLFSRYSREPGVEDGRFGIGLGFVIIRSAAAQHSGTVLVDHPQGCGTRITLTLSTRPGSGTTLHSPVLRVDYAGERDHGLLELSDVLPASLYDNQQIH